MALYRFQLKVRTTSPQHATAGKTVQYLVAVQGAAEVAYLDRTSPATKLRTDLVHDEAVNLPAWAKGDPSAFFRAAYKGEEKLGADPHVTKHYAGRWAYALEMALPRELSREQQLGMARTFLATHLDQKVYYWVMHEPLGKDGLPQPHIHVLFSQRTLDGIERGPDLFFKNANKRQPERGGARKDRFFSERQAPSQLRHAWADMVNSTLEREGHTTRIDPRSLETRGIERRSTHRVRTPADTGTGEDPQEWIAQTRPEEERAAREGWEQRKRHLGIEDSHAVNPAELLAISRQRARDITPGRAVPRQSREMTHEELERLTRRIAHLKATQARRARHLRKLREAQTQHLEARNNPVTLRRLDYLLGYDPAQEEESMHPHGGTFQFAKDSDLSR